MVSEMQSTQCRSYSMGGGEWSSGDALRLVFTAMASTNDCDGYFTATAHVTPSTSLPILKHDICIRWDCRSNINIQCCHDSSLLELELGCMRAHDGIAIQQTSARRPKGHFNLTSSTKRASTRQKIPRTLGALRGHSAD